MSKCERYDITKLRDRARIITILKHRFGIADKKYRYWIFMAKLVYGKNYQCQIKLPITINL